MSNLPDCPSCGSEYAYEDSGLLICPMCGHEWTKESEAEEEEAAQIKDVNGNVLNDGDHVSIVKDLKVKGSSNVIKQGTKIKGIRIVEPEDGHDLDCKVPGFGKMALKSSVVKKID